MMNANMSLFLHNSQLGDVNLIALGGQIKKSCRPVKIVENRLPPISAKEDNIMQLGIKLVNNNLNNEQLLEDQGKTNDDIQRLSKFVNELEIRKADKEKVDMMIDSESQPMNNIQDDIMQLSIKLENNHLNIKQVLEGQNKNIDDVQVRDRE
ncbi:hypothetical protein UPYG_G00259960 [Umbra pygmaea]|uniref:Uncharacterized protein n=1 Tax=Umbra pygmaea TaxID=75934 RepID=A0ABD0W8W8_UMBPY